MDKKKMRMIIISILCFILGVCIQMYHETLLDHTLQGAVIVGQWLRELSLKAGIYNIFAWLIIIMISAIPLLIVIFKKKKYIWDFFSIALSIELFLFLYYLVNPTLLYSSNNLIDVLSYTKMWGYSGFNVILATILCWIFFYLFNYIKNKPENKLELIFLLSAFVYSFMIGISFTKDLLGIINTVSEGNTSVHLVNQTSNVHVLVTVLLYIPKVFIIYILYLVNQFITKLVHHPFDDEILVYSSKLSKVCSKMIVVSLLLAFAANIIQFLLFRKIAHVSFSLEFPILTLVVCTVLILMHEYFKKVKELHDDNASII